MLAGFIVAGSAFGVAAGAADASAPRPAQDLTATTTTTVAASDPNGGSSTTTVPADDERPTGPPEPEVDDDETVAVTTTTSEPAFTGSTSTTVARRSPDAEDEETDPEEVSRNPTSTVSPLLVPGPTDRSVASETPQQLPEGDAAAGDAPTELASTEQIADVASEDDSAEAKVRKVMFGLVGVAALLAVLTVYYWWMTRPEPVTRSRGSRRGGTDVPPTS